MQGTAESRPPVPYAAQPSVAVLACPVFPGAVPCVVAIKIDRGPPNDNGAPQPRFPPPRFPPPPAGDA